MRVLLHYRVNGVDAFAEYESPTEAIHAAIVQINAKKASPQMVTTFDGKVIATQDDLHIAWEDDGLWADL